MDTIGMRLKLIRTECRLRQEDVLMLLQKKYDISLTQASFSRYENDKRDPDRALLKALSEIYGYPVMKLMFSENELKELTEKGLL